MNRKTVEWIMIGLVALLSAGFVYMVYWAWKIL